jgi:diguanylate cyclase (GGDEF)-like protein
LQLSWENPGAPRDGEAGDWVVRLCRAVRETLDAERVIAWLYDAPAQAVTPFASDAPDDGLLEPWAKTKLDALPFACTALLESRPVEIADAQDDERIPAELAADLGIGSIRFEPLLAGRPVGMVSIEPASAAARPELHSLLPVLAAGVGRLATRHESERERRQATFLLELSDTINSSGSIDQMLSSVCERVAAETGARRATIFLFEGGRLVARSSRESDGSYDRSVLTRLEAEPPPPLAEAALQSGTAAIARDPSSPLLSESWRDAFGAGSAVAVPLLADERAIGVLVLDAPEQDRFGAREVSLAEAAARHVGGTVEQALVSDERTSHLRAATIIRRLLEEGAGAVSVREAGEVLARVTRDALSAERATLLLQDDNDQIEHVVSVGADGDFERILRERLSTTPTHDLRIWRLTTRQPKPIFVENARASRLIPPELVEELALQSYVAVPLLSASRPLGIVLCSHSSAPRSWRPDERQLVTQIALEGSLVVENAVLRAFEHERLDRLTHQAFHDSLTKLPNRALFSDRLQHALDRMTRRQQAIAVLFLDLDEFKPINDNFGHDAGDRLLLAVGRRLQSCLRPEDTIARLGGDEFTVLLEDITDVRYAIRVAERIEEALREPFQLDGHDTVVTASIGIAVGNGRESTTDELVRNADVAMYEAKSRGKAQHAVFHEGMSRNSREAGAPDEPEKAVEHAQALESDTGDEQTAPEEAVSEEAVSEAAVATETVVQDVAEEAVAAGEPAVPEEPAESPDNGPSQDGEPGVASTLSEARRRRRMRFPPR